MIMIPKMEFRTRNHNGKIGVFPEKILIDPTNEMKQTNKMNKPAIHKGLPL